MRWRADPINFYNGISITYRIRDINPFTVLLLPLLRLSGRDIFYEFDLNFISGPESCVHCNIDKVDYRRSAIHDIGSILQLQSSDMRNEIWHMSKIIHRRYFMNNLLSKEMLRTTSDEIFWCEWSYDIPWNFNWVF